MYDHLYLVRTITGWLHEVLLTTLMILEQQTVTNPAGLCAISSPWGMVLHNGVRLP